MTDTSEHPGPALNVGDRVIHEDGSTGTVQAFWVVWDDGDASEHDHSVIKPL